MKEIKNWEALVLKDGKYQKANRSAKELVEQWMSNVMEPNVSKDKLQLLLDRLEV